MVTAVTYERCSFTTLDFNWKNVSFGWVGGDRIVRLVCDECFGSVASFLEKKVVLRMFFFQAELRRNIGLLQAEVQKKDGMLQYVSCSPRITLSLHFVMLYDK